MLNQVRHELNNVAQSAMLLGERALRVTLLIRKSVRKATIVAEGAFFICVRCLYNGLDILNV